VKSVEGKKGKPEKLKDHLLYAQARKKREYLQGEEPNLAGFFLQRGRELLGRQGNSCRGVKTIISLLGGISQPIGKKKANERGHVLVHQKGVERGRKRHRRIWREGGASGELKGVRRYRQRMESLSLITFPGRGPSEEAVPRPKGVSPNPEVRGRGGGWCWNS